MGLFKAIRKVFRGHKHSQQPGRPTEPQSNEDAAGEESRAAARSEGPSNEIIAHSEMNAASKSSEATLEEVYDVENQPIGEGTFAIVHKAKSKKTGNIYACKTIQKAKLRGNIAQVKSELEILIAVQHPHVVSLVRDEKSIFETPESVHLVMDLCSGGELFDAIVARGSYTEKDAREVTRMMLSGVSYLHEHGIVHRDLKPENLLLKDNTELSKIKITDFGLSKLLSTEGQMLMTRCGTPAYVAPEVLTGVGHSFPCDMWSLGCITYVLLCGYTPFWGEEQQQLLRAIMDVRFEYEPEYWGNISDEAKGFISACLLRLPAERMTAKNALEHPWMKLNTDGPELIQQVKENFNARRTWRRALKTVTAVNAMKRVGSGSGEPSPVSGVVAPDTGASKMEVECMSPEAVENGGEDEGGKAKEAGDDAKRATEDQQVGKDANTVPATCQKEDQVESETGLKAGGKGEEDVKQGAKEEAGERPSHKAEEEEEGRTDEKTSHETEEGGKEAAEDGRKE